MLTALLIGLGITACICIGIAVPYALILIDYFKRGGRG